MKGQNTVSTLENFPESKLRENPIWLLLERKEKNADKILCVNISFAMQNGRIDLALVTLTSCKETGQ